MDNALDLYSFDKWLKANYGVQTQRDYMCKMETLKRRGITEVTPPSAIFNEVVDLCEDSISNASGRMYEYSILAYQNCINDVRGERIHLIDRIAKIRFEETFPREKFIRPPKQNLRVYKRAIPLCPDESMKLAMMIELNAGVRVGEVVKILPDDITMRKDTKGNDTIWLNVDPNKTSYGRRARVLREDGFFDGDEIYALMVKHLERGCKWPAKAEIQRYFREEMGQTTENPGGESHDLRKYCARGLYRAERLRGKNKKDASETVRKQLGHRKKEYTVGEVKGDGGYIGKVYLEDKGGKYRDKKIDWRTP